MKTQRSVTDVMKPRVNFPSYYPSIPSRCITNIQYLPQTTTPKEIEKVIQQSKKVIQHPKMLIKEKTEEIDLKYIIKKKVSTSTLREFLRHQLTGITDPDEELFNCPD